MFKDYNGFKLLILIFLVCLFFAFVFSGCNSFTPISLENDTRECSDFYTVLQYYSEVGKDSAFVGTVYNECKNSRNDKKQKRIEELCNKLYSDNIKEYQACVK